jgi:hypothetical protein
MNKKDENAKTADIVVGKPDCNAVVQWCRFSNTSTQLPRARAK